MCYGMELWIQGPKRVDQKLQQTNNKKIGTTASDIVVMWNTMVNDKG